MFLLFQDTRVDHDSFMFSGHMIPDELESKVMPKDGRTIKEENLCWLDETEQLRRSSMKGH